VIGVGDLSSGNGTSLVLNHPKSKYKLKNGDEIKVGNRVLKVVIEVDSNESKTENISAVQEQKLSIIPNETEYQKPNFFSVAKDLFKQAVSGEPHLAGVKILSPRIEASKDNLVNVPGARPKG